MRPGRIRPGGGSGWISDGMRGGQGAVAAAIPWPQAGLLGGDIVAGDRQRIEPPGQLDLMHDQPLMAETAFGGGKVEFPHPREALVIQRHRFLPPGQKPLAPMAQGFGVMQAQHLDIGDDQPVALNGGQHF